MKIPTNAKLENCVSHDKHRAVLANIHIDTEANLAVATDGRMMALVPIELDELDTTGPLPPDALQAARKLAKKNNHSDCLLMCNGDIRLSNGVSMPRPTTGGVDGELPPYPKYQQVVPDKDRPVKFAIAFNAALLADLAGALGCEIVTLQFRDELSPIVVLPSEAGSVAGAKGVLMPARMT